MRCFYTNTTFDSVCAAAIVKRKYPDCQLVPIFTENDVITNMTFSDNTITVYAINCLYDFEVLRNISYQCNMIWVSSDKQITHEAVNAGVAVPRYSVGLDKAACAIIWELLYPYDEIPGGVELISQFAQHNSSLTCQAYNAALISNKCVDPEATIWQSILHPNSSIFHVDMLNMGRHIVDYLVNIKELQTFS